MKDPLNFNFELHDRLKRRAFARFSGVIGAMERFFINYGTPA